MLFRSNAEASKYLDELLNKDQLFTGDIKFIESDEGIIGDASFAERVSILKCIKENIKSKGEMIVTNQQLADIGVIPQSTVDNKWNLTGDMAGATYRLARTGKSWMDYASDQFAADQSMFDMLAMDAGMKLVNDIRNKYNISVAEEVVDPKTGKPQEVVKSVKLNKEIEITDSNGKCLGEFDEIDLDNKIFYEDKTAKGLDTINPKTGKPSQTPQEFADKQIYTKTKNRINNLMNAEETRQAKTNIVEKVPNRSELQKIKKFVFRLDGDSPELRKAVENSVQNLQLEFPDYSFEVTFGNN